MQQRTAGNTKRSAGISAAELGRRPTGPPTPVPRNLDRGMQPAKDFQSVNQKDSITQTGRVQETKVTPLSALAENFMPRKTSRKPQTPLMPTDNELDRSFIKWGGPYFACGSIWVRGQMTGTQIEPSMIIYRPTLSPPPPIPIYILYRGLYIMKNLILIC